MKPYEIEGPNICVEGCGDELGLGDSIGSKALPSGGPFYLRRPLDRGFPREEFG
jgi:hypothetical protein